MYVDHKKQRGIEHISVDSLAELTALSTIVGAFSRFTYTRKDLYSAPTIQLIGHTAEVVSHVQNVATGVSAEIGRELQADDIQKFRHPNVVPILSAVAIFQQRTELLAPHMSETELTSSQAVFPPVSHPKS